MHGVLFQSWLGVLGVGCAVITAELAWAFMVGFQAQQLTGRRGDMFWLLWHKSG